MIYRVVIVLENNQERVIYEGTDRGVADDAFAVTAGYTRKFYVGTISWDRTAYRQANT